MIFLLVVDGDLNLLEIGAQEVSNFEMGGRGRKLERLLLLSCFCLFVCFEDDIKDIASKKSVWPTQQQAIGYV